MRTILPVLSVEQTAKMFNVSVLYIKKQYADNAVGLEKMHKKSIETGKKVNGYTSDQLSEMVDFYKKMSV